MTIRTPIKVLTKHKTFVICLILLCPFFVHAQVITGSELLEKSIQYHDPNGEWATANVTFHLSTERADGSTDMQKIILDLPNSYFLFEGRSAGKQVKRELKNTDCHVELEGNSTLNAEQIQKYRLDCESVERYRDYYQYLYGLPMKLRDPGTIVEDEVQMTKFNDQLYYRLKIRYDPEVGAHTWLFFIHPETFAMEGYQFYRNEATKKGEYITLEGITKIGNMLIPQDRKWYTYPEREYLGRDLLKMKKYH